MNRWYALVLLLAASAAVALRGPHVALRPMHNDEAVNAVKFGHLLDQGRYRYDPHEYHGPTLHYAALVCARLSGVPNYASLSESNLRFAPLVFGIGLILLLPLVADGLGRRATLWAGVLTAVSPAFVFYSQYFIHEMLLVFFTALTMAAGWRYWRSRKPGWALLAGAGLGLMQATKETFVFCLAAAAMALLLNHAWNRWMDASEEPIRAPRLNCLHVAMGGLFWGMVAVIFFSSFFTNAQGPADSIRTYLPWLRRAGGASPHIQPWYFYFERLLFFKVGSGPLWSEAAIGLLALVGAGASFARKGLGSFGSASFIRFLSLYTAGLAAIYTIIPYKTPWCFLGFWHGAILLAGVGAVVITGMARTRYARVGVLGVVLIASGQLAWQAWAASTRYAADRRNPFVYAQTSPDLLRLLDKVQAISQASPEGEKTRINVIAAEGDYWPLPWYLRHFSQVGWWDTLPPDPYAPIMIVSAQLAAALDKSRTHLMIGYFELRPGVFNELYVELELWKTFLARNQKERPLEAENNEAGK